MIEVRGLKKRFSLANPKKKLDVEAFDPRQRGRFFHSVESVDLHCPTGEILGLLGPNGAGKTTTLRVLSGILSPDGGEVRIHGRDVRNDKTALQRQIGFISGSTALYERLSVRENLLYFGRLYGLQHVEVQSRIETLVEHLDLNTFIDRRASELSTGMMQRAGLARALIHDPEVLILDEPTTGLDIMATEAVLKFIQELSKAGKTVIFSTHHIEEISLLCNRLTVLLLGRSVFDGPIDEFAGSRQPEKIRSHFMALSHQTELQSRSECSQ